MQQESCLYTTLIITDQKKVVGGQHFEQKSLFRKTLKNILQEMTWNLTFMNFNW